MHFWQDLWLSLQVFQELFDYALFISITIVTEIKDLKLVATKDCENIKNRDMFGFCFEFICLTVFLRGQVL